MIKAVRKETTGGTRNTAEHVASENSADKKNEPALTLLKELGVRQTLNALLNG